MHKNTIQTVGNTELTLHSDVRLKFHGKNAHHKTIMYFNTFSGWDFFLIRKCLTALSFGAVQLLCSWCNISLHRRQMWETQEEIKSLESKSWMALPTNKYMTNYQVWKCQRDNRDSSERMQSKRNNSVTQEKQREVGCAAPHLVLHRVLQGFSISVYILIVS